VPPETRDMAAAMGFAVAKGTGLAAAFEYADGLLKVNDRTHDAGAVLASLRTADAQLHALVAGWSEPQPVLARAPMQAPEEPAPASVNEPAAAAAPEAAPASAPVAAVAQSN